MDTYPPDAEGTAGAESLLAWVGVSVGRAVGLSLGAIVSVAVAAGGGWVSVEDGVSVRVAVGSVVSVGVALGGINVLVAGIAVTLNILGVGSRAGAEQAATIKKSSSKGINFPGEYCGFIIFSIFIDILTIS